MSAAPLTCDELHALMRPSILGGFSELLPGCPVRLEASPAIAESCCGLDACVISIAGPTTGFLVLLADPGTTRTLGWRLVSSMLGQPEPPPDTPLDELAESALREICNRIGARLVVSLPPLDSHNITFPIFFHGQDVHVHWDQEICALQRVDVGDLSLRIVVGLSPRREARTSPGERLKTLDALRAHVLKAGA